MVTLQEQLKQLADGWECLGHPAVLERFVLRNGKAFAPGKRIGKKMKAKECFKNATSYVMKSGGTYVEGYCMTTDFAFPILHAWVTLDGEAAMDPTLDAAERQYFGVKFHRADVLREMVRNKTYGMLDTGFGLNAKVIFGVDPELRDICARISKTKWRNETEAAALH
jgi:hypothetical protein